MTALLTRYPPPSPILDLGCGAGDLAISLAKLGYQVHGIDFVDLAIENARDKMGALPAETRQLLSFQVADALKPTLLQKKFGAVVDSGFYHLFEPDQCEQLAEEVASILLPRGRYYLHEFAIQIQAANMPRQITAEELQARFTADQGWHIHDIQTVEFLSQVDPPLPAICACIERLSV
jgi:ubiquinone/menaquinone biosynthesis C-methylase UbiE